MTTQWSQIINHEKKTIEPGDGRLGVYKDVRRAASRAVESRSVWDSRAFQDIVNCYVNCYVMSCYVMWLVVSCCLCVFISSIINQAFPTFAFWILLIYQKKELKKTHLPNFTKWQAVTQANVAAGTSGSMREVSQALRHGWGVSACI
jgi:hypothetical protein